MLTLITGGIKSGKSVFAEKLAAEQGDEIVYIATAIITDVDMQKRVDIHKKRRPQHWTTIEEHYHLLNIEEVLPQIKSTVMIDCLTTLMTNKLWHDHPELFENDTSYKLDNALFEEMCITAKRLAASKHNFIVVSNEVGMGLIPPTRIGRIFCDLQGKVNQAFAEEAQNVYLTVSGIPIKIK